MLLKATISPYLKIEQDSLLSILPCKLKHHGYQISELKS